MKKCKVRIRVNKIDEIMRYILINVPDKSIKIYHPDGVFTQYQSGCSGLPRLGLLGRLRLHHCHSCRKRPDFDLFNNLVC